MATAAATCSPMASAAGRAMAHQRWAKHPSEEERRAHMLMMSRAADRRFYVQAMEMHPTASDADIERAAQSLRSAWYADLSRRRWAAHPPKSAQQKGAQKGRAA